MAQIYRVVDAQYDSEQRKASFVTVVPVPTRVQATSWFFGNLVGLARSLCVCVLVVGVFVGVYLCLCLRLCKYLTYLISDLQRCTVNVAAGCCCCCCCCGGCGCWLLLLRLLLLLLNCCCCGAGAGGGGGGGDGGPGGCY